MKIITAQQLAYREKEYHIMALNLKLLQLKQANVMSFEIFVIGFVKQGFLHPCICAQWPLDLRSVTEPLQKKTPTRSLLNRQI